MRRMLHATAMCGAVMMVVGCGSASVHSIATDETIVTDSRIVGTWVAADQNDQDQTTYTVASDPDDAKRYIVTIAGGESQEKQDLSAVIVDVSGNRFLDLWPTDDDPIPEQQIITFIPVHQFVKIVIGQDTLSISLLKKDWLDEELKTGRIALAHTHLDGDFLLLTAETAALQEFLKKYGGDENAFGDTGEMKRQGAKQGKRRSRVDDDGPRGIVGRVMTRAIGTNPIRISRPRGGGLGEARVDRGVD